MNQTLWSQVDAYFEDCLISCDSALSAALAHSAAAGLPPHNVSANQGKLLFLLAQMQGARKILEIGTLGGYSTIWLARALPEDGFLLTLEADRRHAFVARNNIAKAGLAEKVVLRLDPAAKSLAEMDLENVDPFDLIFIDADKKSNLDYLKWAVKFSHTGSVVILDNVVRNGAVCDFKSTDPNVSGIRQVCDFIKGHPNLAATAIQTVGSKGYDGFILVRVQ